jgi:hypothetical protein
MTRAEIWTAFIVSALLLLAVGLVLWRIKGILVISTIPIPAKMKYLRIDPRGYAGLT